jgi:phosphatidylserine synthase
VDLLPLARYVPPEYPVACHDVAEFLSMMFEGVPIVAAVVVVASTIFEGSEHTREFQYGLLDGHTVHDVKFQYGVESGHTSHILVVLFHLGKDATGQG